MLSKIAIAAISAIGKQAILERVADVVIDRVVDSKIRSRILRRLVKRNLKERVDYYTRLDLSDSIDGVSAIASELGLKEIAEQLETIKYRVDNA